ncbi:MAG TPA: hypothetical protein VFF06_33830 [Polyangia bacterium]|nr:hypothetical protein [Polyangia bacterium]
MRRSELLKLTVHCPHFNRPVAVTRNAAIDRLVACDESEVCRDPAPAASGPTDHARPFPHGCPVFPSLAR